MVQEITQVSDQKASKLAISVSVGLSLPAEVDITSMLGLRHTRAC